MREVDYARFVEVWTRSSSIPEVARELDIPQWCVRDVAAKLRAAGVKLKRFTSRAARSRWSRHQPLVLGVDVTESDLPDPVLHLRPALAVERSTPPSEMVDRFRHRYETPSPCVDPCWDPLDESTGTPWDARFMVETAQGGLDALRSLGFDLVPDGSLEWSSRE